MIDWNFLVGIGTVILAAVTAIYVNQSRKQTKILLKQLDLQIGMQIPRLSVQKIEFKPKSIKISIKNVTNYPAFEVGLDTSFYVIRQRLFSDKSSESEITWGEAVKLQEQGQTIYSKYYPIFPEKSQKLVHENKEVHSASTISFFSPNGISV